MIFIKNKSRILRKNKKAVESQFFVPGTIIFWIIFTFFVGISAIFFKVMLTAQALDLSKVQEGVETLNLIGRFTKSPYCFLQYDDEVVSYRIIDINKFNEDKLNSCFTISCFNFPAFKITIKSEPIRLSRTYNTNNWDEKVSVKQSTEDIQIKIKFNNKIYNGLMKIEMQNIQ